jgi:predicted Rossmann fold nucleotide-binding protein DprA/Smf involved in DNA uptake
VLSPIESRVLDAVRPGDAHVDEVIRRADLPPGAALETLLALELRGVVEQQPGMRFRARAA